MRRREASLEHLSSTCSSQNSCDNLPCHENYMVDSPLVMVVSTFSLMTTMTVIMTYRGDHCLMAGISSDRITQPHKEPHMAK